MESEFTACPCGTAGHDILCGGSVIAWTTDGYWAALIVALLNQTEKHRRSLPARITDEEVPELPGGEDLELTARQAIGYLAQHGVLVEWTFSETNPPPESVRHLIASYFVDGEITETVAEIVCRYLMTSLAADHLRITTCKPVTTPSHLPDAGFPQDHAG